MLPFVSFRVDISIKESSVRLRRCKVSDYLAILEADAVKFALLAFERALS